MKLFQAPAISTAAMWSPEVAKYTPAPYSVRVTYVSCVCVCVRAARVYDEGTKCCKISAVRRRVAHVEDDQRPVVPGELATVPAPENAYVVFVRGVCVQSLYVHIYARVCRVCVWSLYVHIYARVAHIHGTE